MKIIKSRIKEDERVGHVALNSAKRNTYRLSVRKPKERDNLEDLEVEGITILKNLKEVTGQLVVMLLRLSVSW
jgi:hypothetical protein